MFLFESVLTEWRALPGLGHRISRTRFLCKCPKRKLSRDIGRGKLNCILFCLWPKKNTVNNCRKNITIFLANITNHICCKAESTDTRRLDKWHTTSRLLTPDPRGTASIADGSQCYQRIKIKWTKTMHHTPAYSTSLWQYIHIIAWLQLEHWVYWRPELVEVNLLLPTIMLMSIVDLHSAGSWSISTVLSVFNNSQMIPFYVVASRTIGTHSRITETIK